MGLSVVRGEMAGITDLACFLRDRVEPTAPETPFVAMATNAELGDREPVVEEEEEEEEGEGPSYRGSLAIARMWLRSAELEEDGVPTVTLGRRVADAGGSVIFTYTSTRPLEFEDEDTVEVRIAPGLQGRRIGFLDVPRCDGRELAIRDLQSHLGEGETIALVDKRDRVSKERRRRAIDRITSGESVIPNLIDFFDPSADVLRQEYDAAISEAELVNYGLNEGQRAAFRQLLQYGPVGLLQGPPGSGKTRFIAAFVHWLLAHGRAQRILVASQSHEAVNKVLEELLRTYRDHGGHADLLRVGSRGATERVRPYQARSLRDGYRLRFENGLKTRVAAAAGAVGIPRDLAYGAVEVHRRLGALGRLLELAEEATRIEDATPGEQRRAAARLLTLSRAFARESEETLGRPVDVGTEGAAAVVELAYKALLERYPKTSPADLATVRKILALAHDWIDTLRSGHRNFDEFLAKTRSVVAGTCVGLGQSQIRLDAGAFDWVIVDEAARCTHGELAVPLQVGSRVVLVGDQRQLRPMVDRDVMAGLREEFPSVPRVEIERSDFERAFLSNYGRFVAKVLDEQYRMAPVICDVVSKVFYRPHGVTLRPSKDRIPDACFVNLPGILKPPIIWFDTEGAPGSEESVLNGDRDFWNEAEVEGALALLERLSGERELVAELSSRPDPAIGVICMYSEQKRRIERAWYQRPFPDAFRRAVTIDTVDAYQGKENAIVILTPVRANSELRAGHVRSPNRCNVAISRAKERLYIVGSTKMWSNSRCGSPMTKVLKEIRSLDDAAARVVPVTEIAR